PLVVEVARRAAVGIDDPVAYRQAEAGSRAHGFGREERLKELLLVLRRHSRTVIPHLEADLLPDVGQPDLNPAALPSGALDGLLRVDDEIQQHLLELGERREDLADR